MYGDPPLSQGNPVSVVTLFAGGITLSQMQQNSVVSAPVAYMLGAALRVGTLKLWKCESG